MTNQSLILNEHSVCASAPGKVILFGEHAVVYGEPALAAALSDLRIVVLITPTFDDPTISIHMLDLPSPIHCDISTEKVIKVGDKLCCPPTSACADAIAQILSEDDAERCCLDSLAISAMTPLIYLIYQIASEAIIHHGLQIHVRSQDLPVGAGLGSSAAFSVASAAALLQLRQMLHTKQSSSPITRSQRPGKDFLQEINQYSFYSEILLHGTPSGIDNAVSTFGGAILFTKQCSNQPTVTHASTNASLVPAVSSTASTAHMEIYTKDQMPALASMPLLIVYTHVPRSTKILVAGVREFYDQHKAVITCMLHAMGEIATDAAQWLVSVEAGQGPLPNDNARFLLRLVETNQHLLRAVGVSHPSLDRICSVVKTVAPGQAAAKLTGAGGGGCAIVLFDSNTESCTQKRVQRALERAAKPWKFVCLPSSVGGDGVLLLPPEQFPSQKSANWRHTWLSLETLVAATVAAGSVSLLMYAIAVSRIRGQ